MDAPRPPIGFRQLMAVVLAFAFGVLAWRGGLIDTVTGAKRTATVLKTTQHAANGTSAAGGPKGPQRAPLSPVQTEAGAALLAVQRLIKLGYPLFCAGGTGRYVALTFDDGPGAYTLQTLAILHAAGARATFFLVGRNLAWYPGRVEQEVPENAVGDHTWNHLYLTKIPLAERETEIQRTQEAVAKATLGQVVLFRPPGGYRDHDVDRLINSYGMLEVLWSTDSMDSAGATTSEVLRNSIAGLKPGAIILLHENRGTTLEMLPKLLQEIGRLGFQTVTLPELLRLDPPTTEQLRKNAAVGACVG